ncbi:MAG: cytochrome c3 family protein, partial [Planctomycetota bacterium]
PSPSPAPPATRKGPARGDFGGTIACAGCHEEAYEGWRRSSHAQTSYFTTPEELPPEALAGERVEHPPGGTQFGRDESGPYAETLGPDGLPHRYPITLTAGQMRVRFFVTTLADGRMQVLPAMLELPTRTWFDYTYLIFGALTKDWLTPPVVKPGDPSFWTGPVRSWDAKCAACHMSGRTPIEPGPDGRGPRSLWRAYAVDCEACHGPGRLHAGAWKRLEMDAHLARLQDLPRGTRTEVCTRCHQEGEILDPPYVRGQDLYAYKDTTLVVDPERIDPAGRALELIYDGLPFATSECARRAGLTCSTCHAPHGSPQRSLLRRAPEDGSFCLPCHERYVKDPSRHSHHEPKSTGSQCVLCHMPFLTIERGHGAVADHTIGIPRLGLEADRVQTDACTWCHAGDKKAPEGAPEVSAQDLETAYGYWWPGRGWPQPWMAALAKARRGEKGADEDLVAVIGDEANAREVRASAALLLGRYARKNPDAILDASRDADDLVRRSAIKALAGVEGERADQRLLEALEDPSRAVRIAAARTALRGWRRVQANETLLRAIRPVLDDDARRVPDDDQRWFRLGATCDLLGDAEGALEAYEHEVALDPFAKAVRR